MIETVPEVPRSSEQIGLRSTLTHAATGEQPTLKLAHEKLLHLIVVSRDLATFQHLHPEPRAGGKLETEAVFPAPGEYLFFADFTTEDGESHGARAAMTVEGPGLAPEPLRPNTDEPQWDRGVMATLATEPEALVTEKDTQIVFRLTDTDNGSPVADLRPYLGAIGHAVILSADGQDYLHAHPLEPEGGSTHGGQPGHEESGHGGRHAHAHHPGRRSAGPGEMIGSVAFHTRFPRPGLYKVWGQFDVGGTVRTFPFVLSVRPSG
jgi:hypothetical protein